MSSRTLAASPSLALCMVIAAGCSSRPVVTEITGVRPGEFVPGIPFRTISPYTLTLMRRQPDGSYKEQLTDRVEMADTDRLYSAGFRGEAFANHTFGLKLAEDGTLTKVSLSSESKAAEDLAGIQAGIAAASTAPSAFDAARAEREAAKENKAKTAETELREGEDALIAAKVAFDTAEAALRKVRALSANATDAERADAIAAAEEAQLRANIAYRRAGLSEPYPGVFTVK